MNLKKKLLAFLDNEQLKELCGELEVNADRRSRDAMATALGTAKRAKPEQMVEKLTVRQLRELLEVIGESTGGRRNKLVERLLVAARRGASGDEGDSLGVRDGDVADSMMRVSGRRTRGPRTSDDTVQYRHADLAVQRPDAGVQDQFQARKPPRAYRYDSSLDPALSWDEQRERDLGEWLLGLIMRAGSEGERAVFAQPHEWQGGGARVTSISDAARLLQQISKPFLNWAGKAERHEIRVPTVPLFVHERHSTKAILDGIRHRKARGHTLDLFGDPQMDIRENLEAYEHKGPWQNRMILGDSLAVMNSLLEFEGLGGRVQMIYIDPPYGVKFGSNFQPFVRKRDVKHGGDEHMTREPEMVKAYRDTWELGLHSYLTYLRDRLLLAKELLHPSGSIFVQISDENLHIVRGVIDEVFGRENFCRIITIAKTSGLGATLLPVTKDFLIWYARDISHLKYRQIFIPKLGQDESEGQFRLRDTDERLYRLSDLTGQNNNVASCIFTYEFNGKKFSLPSTRQWKTTRDGIDQLVKAGRIVASGRNIYYKRYLDDFAVSALADAWLDTGSGGFTEAKIYSVQTNVKVLQRCLLMTTDPGDLVIDPTCGSGTTAYVAEQWGRRWITIDTSRVPLALARQRLLTATFPYYELKSPTSGPAGGFAYKRRQNRKGEEMGGLVPHITLKSIAKDEPPAMEVLVDRPEEISGVTRVAGSFVVEATISPVQPLQAGGEECFVDSEAATHIERMTELLRQSKTLRLPGNRELLLGSVRRTIDTEYLHAEASEGDKRVGIVFGPSDGAVSAMLVYEAAREAHFLRYDRLYFFGFAVEPNARSMIEEQKKLRIPATYVAVTPDVAMSDLLKTTRASEIFSVTGLPDIGVRRSEKRGPEGQLLYEVELNGLDLFDPESLQTESVGGENVPCWMLDSDHDGMCFYASQVFFPRTSAWDNLQRSLKATFDESVWTHLAGTVSEPFALGERRRVAVKVIDERGNELLRVLDVTE